MNKKSFFKTRELTIIGILSGISIALGLTPLGFIPVGPTRATIMHIPVIIGGIVSGPIVGLFVGLIFGLFSIYQALVNPTPVSFVFLNPLVSVLPRLLIGIFSYYSYKSLKKFGKKKTKILINSIWILIILYLFYGIYENSFKNFNLLGLSVNGILLLISLILFYYTRKKIEGKSLDIALATIIGTLTNTVGVLSMIYFLYGERFALALGLNPGNVMKAVLGIAFSNGIPESIIAVILVVAVVNILNIRGERI